MEIIYFLLLRLLDRLLWETMKCLFGLWKNQKISKTNSEIIIISRNLSRDLIVTSLFLKKGYLLSLAYI